ncbi:cytochrome-c peroxidase [Sneathiella glossodoripedis]|uniref:cytochrome-c peroxidase n=1 Tax=Sneathiella glossodoripedis TaxID=418853 RepID=UPI00046EB5B1|nr:cytochrome c peroxidase [Sneathiella glossodoripedis]
MKFVRQCLLFFLVMVCGAQDVSADVTFNKAEKIVISRFGPWPPVSQADVSNKASGNPEAIELGEQLFGDRRFSKGNKLSCKDCHQPEFSFADSVSLNRGFAPLKRNTLSLYNLRWSNWFGWSGASDSLWMQSLRPIISPDEMNMTVAKVGEIIKNDRSLNEEFERIFGDAGNLNGELLYVQFGKILAAYQETLISPRSRFDQFRDALLAGDKRAIDLYPEDAKRGLKIFLGKGRCHFCHFGPLFTTGEFADIGMSQFNADGSVDKGRYTGIQTLLASPYNLLGKYNDDLTGTVGVRTRHIRLLHRNFGEFKIPSLRNVSNTSPYMHNGSLKTLEDVVAHYSELDIERIHQDTEALLRPLGLSDEEKQDLVSFLKTL